MTHLKTFPRGGVRPPPRKDDTSAEPIENAALPTLAVIPMRQHVGEPAECLVKTGDEIREGMLIGRATRPRSANVHSSIPGRVVDVAPVHTPNGDKSLAVFVELSGEFDRSGRGRSPAAWQALSDDEIVARIRRGGVVGLGGSLEPTHEKLAAARDRGAEVVVGNGVECEPFLSADRRLMLEKSAQVADGLRIARRIVKARRMVLALSEGSESAVPFFEGVFRSPEEGFSLEVLEARYPQGEETTLIATLRVPAGSPVFNVGTLFAIWEAVALEKPLIERVVTVAGSAVRRPRNLKVRIGTPFGELFDECGGLSDDCGALILGGPMAGHAQQGITVPVTKGVNGVIALDRRDAAARPVPCIRCGDCVDACPWGLWPVSLHKLVERRNTDRALREGLLECTECGACAYACPSRIPLVAVLRAGKRAAAERGHG